MRNNTDPNVELRASPIEGLGVFARRRFAAGEIVRPVNVVREVTKEMPLRQSVGEEARHCAYPDGRILLLGAPDRHLNHSCDPNAHEVYDEGEYRIVARRVIEPDEEITVDYLINNSGGDSWPCSCGAHRCRGETGTSFFDFSAAFQREYAPLLADWFRRRHAGRF